MGPPATSATFLIPQRAALAAPLSQNERRGGQIKQALGEKRGEESTQSWTREEDLEGKLGGKFNPVELNNFLISDQAFGALSVEDSGAETDDETTEDDDDDDEDTIFVSNGKTATGKGLSKCFKIVF